MCGTCDCAPKGYAPTKICEMNDTIIHFVVEKVAALFAQEDELAYLVIFLFDGQRQGALQQSTT